jgi:hypothetical protein
MICCSPFRRNSLWGKKCIGHLVNKTLKPWCVGPSHVTTHDSDYWPATLIELKGTIHSVTIKFLNWRYYSNTTNAIYRGWTGLVRENVYLYDAQVSTRLVDAYENYKCFGINKYFSSFCVVFTPSVRELNCHTVYHVPVKWLQVI